MRGGERKEQLVLRPRDSKKPLYPSAAEKEKKEEERESLKSHTAWTMACISSNLIKGRGSSGIEIG